MMIKSCKCSQHIVPFCAASVPGQHRQRTTLAKAARQSGVEQQLHTWQQAAMSTAAAILLQCSGTAAAAFSHEVPSRLACLAPAPASSRFYMCGAHYHRMTSCVSSLRCLFNACNPPSISKIKCDQRHQAACSCSCACKARACEQAGAAAQGQC